MRAWFLPLLIGLVAAVAVLVSPQPGITLDEPFNVWHGQMLAQTVRQADWIGYEVACEQLPDHPPLGRLWLGLFQTDSGDPKNLQFPAARLAPAQAFGLLVFLIGWMTTRWHGPLAGATAAVSVILLPRTFGHAHIASLETFVNLTYGGCILFLADRWGTRSPAVKTAAIGGVLFGLALLTKIQAAFLPVSVGLWMLVLSLTRPAEPVQPGSPPQRFSQSRVVSRLLHAGGLFVLWGSVGSLVFLVGWPWLWDGFPSHLLEYFGHAQERATLLTWYFGEALQDRLVPWHAPWLFSLTTVPVGLLGLGFLGAAGTARSHNFPALIRSRETLIALAMLMPLVIFSLPGVPDYDSERLFSMIFALSGVFIGIGCKSLSAWLIPRTGAIQAQLMLWSVLACQGWGLITMAPCHLSYYNLLVGGLPGANTLGLPTTYWGDSLTEEFLQQAAEEIPPGSIVQVLPVMHHQQLPILAQNPHFKRRQLKVAPYNTVKSPYVLWFSRKDYLPQEFRRLADAIPLPPSASLPHPHPQTSLPDNLVELRRSGVLLAALTRVR